MPAPNSPRRASRSFPRIFAILAIGSLAAAFLARMRLEKMPVHPDLPTATVRRADVEAVVLTSGRVASSRSTDIRCTLEQLDLPPQGGGQAASQKEGASAIISLVPDGANVRKGEVICELDSSDYEELARRQRIVVEEATAAHSQASLALEVAKLALRSYQEGEKGEVIREYEGEIALAKADLSRQSDRALWTRRMLGKGYASAAQAASDGQEVLRLTEKLSEMELALRNFQAYTAPRESLTLESEVIGAEATLRYQASRLSQEKARLDHYQAMVDRCTIRAPHDGYVVYANRPGREPRVYLGAPVRERMRLFSLPDPSELEVEALVHETDIDRVRAGMPATVRVEALPSRSLIGRVESVTPVPQSDQSFGSANQVAYFLGHVELSRILPGVRPGMTAEISILSDLHRGVLTVPTTAVRQEDGQQVCYVDLADRLERRPVKVIPGNHELAEVVEGLIEGEHVVAEAQLVDPGAL
jgi:HlyD family secretion protein